MAEIRCPNCGRNNSDLLDICQFCQAPLKNDAVLRSGEKPTKKNTGELEPILPDWLKDVRQQARDSAQEEASQAASREQTDQPPDLLAGLASQTGGSGDEDVPDWLAGIHPTPASTPAPSASELGDDFFAQFNESPAPVEPVSTPSEQEDAPPWMMETRKEATVPLPKDELSEWFTQASQQPEETVEADGEPGDSGWLDSLDRASSSAKAPAPKEEEDLSWLHHLEAASRNTGELQTPAPERDQKADFETPSTPFGAPDDLSWLDRLGGIEGTSQPDQPSRSGIPPQDDRGWLNHLGTAPEPPPVDAAPNRPGPLQPFVPDEDLSWLNTLGSTSEPDRPSSPAEDQRTSEEDLSWLNNLGASSEASQAPAAQEDAAWLNQLGGEAEPFALSPFGEETDATPETLSPQRTVPLSSEESEPDWLKRATEAPSMPAPGNVSTDWFAGSGEPPQEQTPTAAPATAPFDAEDIFSTPGESASLSNQEVDSLFSVEMPDWLSRPDPETTVPVSEQENLPRAEEAETLAPVELPSWVQAMRPVEAVISETTSSVANQPAETEGPLAGLHGVIPIAPVGSSKRRKAVPLTLQTTEEQQASVLLLEQILGSETSPRSLGASSFVTTQRWLRWIVAALFLIALSSVIFMRSQIMPIPGSLPGEAGSFSNAVIGIPANANILVVIDYEPALAGEMEAIGGPLLDQVVLLSQPNLSFISTSPNGAALVERLRVNTGINQMTSQYRNLGFLPGGSAGVLGFMEAPAQIVPMAEVQSFSDYDAVVVLTDHAESGRVWVEQLQSRRQVDPALSNQPLLMLASAQAGPLLQPYVSSQQITGMVSGLSDAARYELVNNNRPGTARAYWDAFGTGLMIAVSLIVLGSLWSLVTGLRARRASADQG